VNPTLAGGRGDGAFALITLRRTADPVLAAVPGERL